MTWRTCQSMTPNVWQRPLLAVSEIDSKPRRERPDDDLPSLPTPPALRVLVNAFPPGDRAQAIPEKLYMVAKMKNASCCRRANSPLHPAASETEL
jgi:hypothetical protein